MHGWSEYLRYKPSRSPSSTCSRRSSRNLLQLPPRTCRQAYIVKQHLLNSSAIENLHHKIFAWSGAKLPGSMPKIKAHSMLGAPLLCIDCPQSSAPFIDTFTCKP